MNHKLPTTDILALEPGTTLVFWHGGEKGAIERSGEDFFYSLRGQRIRARYRDNRWYYYKVVQGTQGQREMELGPFGSPRELIRRALA